MATIQTSRTEQIGGWFNIQIIPLPEITFCPNILTNSNSNLLEITEAENSLEVLPVGESIDIKETPRYNKSGTVYTIKADVEFARQDVVLDNFLQTLQLPEKVIIIGTKHDGKRKVFGSKKFPLELIFNPDHGKKLQDGTVTNISVSGKIPQKPVFLIS